MGVGIDGMFERGHVAAVHGLGGPIGDHRGGDFGVELQTPDVTPETEGLVVAQIGPGEPFGPGGDVERLAVPVKESRGRGQALE